MAIEIIEAKPEHAAEISHLGNVTFAETFGHLFPKDTLLDYLHLTFNVAKIEKGLHKPDNYFLLAYYNGDPVGFLKMKRRSEQDFVPAPNQVQLQKVYVLKALLGKKLGAALLNQCHAKAEEEGAEYIWLSVLRSNDTAIRFYRRYGYRIIGEHQFSIGTLTFQFNAMGLSFNQLK